MPSSVSEARRAPLRGRPAPASVIPIHSSEGVPPSRWTRRSAAVEDGGDAAVQRGIERGADRAREGLTDVHLRCVGGEDDVQPELIGCTVVP
ncbi:MAG: hypothetical protein CVU56_00460 [Deltaproteobacteria bacterium HGW-Deltaproteobacteria-14]|nr:MAG: hypothetical protein CVU56_00460 [Deltaproteobacteria bacterium HGW-Deltaproteobacteria-14]